MLNARIPKSPAVHHHQTAVVSEKAIRALSAISANGSEEARGAIFTRVEVVEFILDLAGYVEGNQLHKKKVLEPSFGGGDFLFQIVKRLLSSWRHEKKRGHIEVDLVNSIRAVELHKPTFESTKDNLRSFLLSEGLSEKSSGILVNKWLLNGDFLLMDFGGQFDFVCGNPPYVRQELIHSALMEEYRKRYVTIYDRADLYVPFIENSLRSLGEKGTLSFICADRWMKNRYGGPLRHFISKNFHLKIYVDMVSTNAFHSDVIAYPAITVISKEREKYTRIAHRPEIDRKILKSLSSCLISRKSIKNTRDVKELGSVVNGSEPWLLESPDQMRLIRKLEEKFPSLEEAGCKVSIGVATGADKAFIGHYEGMNVEPDRKLPLVTTKDIVSGRVKWKGYGVINPFGDDGKLVDLKDYPLLKKYLNARKDVIANRHCAKKNPDKWFRTIDKITPSIAKQKKLLVPDIKGEAHIVYEGGKLYPHHNLYYITSSSWNLRALEAVLLSSIAKLFVATYSTQMHGGFLRFQAQYLRRIRLPQWDAVSKTLREELIRAAKDRDIDACNRAAFRLYGLTHEERSILGGNGE